MILILGVIAFRYKQNSQLAVCPSYRYKWCGGESENGEQKKW